MYCPEGTDHFTEIGVAEEGPVESTCRLVLIEEQLESLGQVDVPSLPFCPF
jgi:hypothetical protein